MPNHDEWAACTEMRQMEGYLRNRTSPRKLRLLAVACCRRVECLLKDARSFAALSVAERYAEGLAGSAQLQAAAQAATQAAHQSDNTPSYDHYLLLSRPVGLPYHLPGGLR